MVPAQHYTLALGVQSEVMVLYSVCVPTRALGAEVLRLEMRGGTRCWREEH